VLEDVKEKTLGQILRVLLRIPAMSGESVQWEPVKLVKFSQSRLPRRGLVLCREHNLVLVLGAGASIEHGLLSWHTLLQELLLTTIQASSDDTALQSRVLARLFQEIFQPNALVSPRYLQNSFKKQYPNEPIAFLKTVRDTLYRGLDANKETLLFTEIRKLCMAVGRQPNLKAIITYNYDDLLEEELKRRGNDLRFLSIYEPGVHPAADQLPIYHPHGFLPRDGNLTESNRVVLSEDY
jgi:SIR2-like domain